MDDLDRSLIALLRRDSRTPVASLAVRLRVARATVRARMERLVETGVITGFTVTLGTDIAEAVRAVMMVEVEGQAADRVMAALSGLPEVRRLHATNGRWDIVAELETRTLGDFDALLRRIRLVPGIRQSESSILLATARDGRPRPDR